MEKIIRNSVECLECGEVIESKHRHDFVGCGCGNIAVDGGHEYIRRIGNGITKHSYKDTSITEPYPGCKCPTPEPTLFMSYCRKCNGRIL